MVAQAWGLSKRGKVIQGAFRVCIYVVLAVLRSWPRALLDLGALQAFSIPCRTPPPETMVMMMMMLMMMMTSMMMVMVKIEIMMMTMPMPMSMTNPS